MKVIIGLCLISTIGFVYGGFLAAPTLVRTPSLDSAIIKSDRIGGNFAYSTAESHAYAALAPIVQTVVAAPIALPQFPVIQQSVITVPKPIFANPGIIAQAPAVISSPIAAGPISVGTPISVAAESPSSVAIDEDTVAIESA